MEFYSAIKKNKITSFIRRWKEPGMVVHTCNPSTWEAETGGSRLMASISYLGRPSAT